MSYSTRTLRFAHNLELIDMSFWALDRIGNLLTFLKLSQLLSTIVRNVVRSFYVALETETARVVCHKCPMTTRAGNGFLQAVTRYVIPVWAVFSLLRVCFKKDASRGRSGYLHRKHLTHIVTSAQLQSLIVACGFALAELRAGRISPAKFEDRFKGARQCADVVAEHILAEQYGNVVRTYFK